MAVTVEKAAPEVSRRRSSFILRFISTIALWSIALAIAFSGYEVFFWLLISGFGLVALWEFYGMLDYDRPAEFQDHGNALRGDYVGRAAFTISPQLGPVGSYDFETLVLVFFLLTMFTRQMFARLRHDEPLKTMAYTLFGLLYVLWLFNFVTKIVYLTPRSSTGMVTGQFYCLYLIAVTKFSDMGAYLTGSLDWPTSNESAH